MWMPHVFPSSAQLLVAQLVFPLGRVLVVTRYPVHAASEHSSISVVPAIRGQAGICHSDFLQGFEVRPLFDPGYASCLHGKPNPCLRGSVGTFVGDLNDLVSVLVGTLVGETGGGVKPLQSRM